MKKHYTLLILVLSCLMVGAQSYSPSPKNLNHLSKVSLKEVKDGNYNPINQVVNPYVHSGKAVSEIELGTTYYDLQSNTSAPSNRFYRYADGTMASVWTRGMTPPNYGDRGTGYNYFNGADWLAAPATRIETQKTGWPSYAPMGDGEIVAAHHNTAGIVITKRNTRGTGTWSESIVPGPAGAVDISWPKIVSNGENNMNIHMLACTYSAYQNLDLALLYYRSSNGGETWEVQHSVLPGMTSAENIGFSADTYSWAEPRGDTLAFLVCDPWTDMFIMKSNDNGDTWEKIMIWEHPYPMYNGTPTDSLYVPDAAGHIAFDQHGKLHVVFGVYRAVVTDWSQGYTYFPFANGIAYWNEDMPAWTDTDINTLDPDALFETGNLIAWTLDLNNNGQLDIVDDYGNYGVGAASQPQITIDENGYIYLVYSGVTEGYDNGAQQYRHIWARGSSDGGVTWNDFYDITGDIVHMLDECVFPTVAYRTSPDKIHLIYQSDNEPGLALRGDLDSPTENVIWYAEFDKSDVINIGTKDMDVNDFTVAQNYPNPFNGSTQIAINLKSNSVVDVQVSDLLGRVVITLPTKTYQAGEYLIPVNAQSLLNGVYTYTVTVNGNSITNKMVIK